MAAALDLSHLSDTELLEMEFLLGKRAEFAVMSEEEERTMERRARLEASPAEFFKEAWRVMEPSTPLEWSWHYDYIGEHLLAAYQGQIRRLIINVPPRTSKTNYATVSWPAWCWTRKPSMRFLAASYSSELSTGHSAKRRRLIESAWYQSLWPISFARDTNRQDQYLNTKEGEMIATSVGATATGRGGDVLILDDGLSADDAKSKAKRTTLHEWFPNTFRQRLNDPDKGVIVAIEQRTHTEDFTGWVMANEPGQWVNVVVPLVADEPKAYSFPISHKTFTREIGDVLQPGRFTDAVIATRRVWARTFATQDQQKPAPDSGIVFMREWWKYRKVPREKYDVILTSWDMAVEGNADSDYNVGMCIGKAGADLDILDVFRKRLAYPEQKKAVSQFAGKHSYATKHLVEKKANGPAVVADLKNLVSGLIALEPQGSKIQRADAASAPVEAGNVYLLDAILVPGTFDVVRNEDGTIPGALWIADFIEETAVFPNGANDDQIDSFSQAANYLRGRNYSYGLLGFAKQQQESVDQAKEEFMERAKNVGKVDHGDNAVACGKCTSRAVVRIGSSYRCNACGNTWPAVASTETNNPAYSRGDTLRK